MKAIKNILKTIVITLTMTMNAQDLQLNKTQSEINWTGKAAFNSYSLTGSLTAKEGSITIKNNSIVSLIIIVDMKSLDHENKDLKTHLKDEDFFEVNTYSIATFELIKPVIIENNKAILVGKMTIKNITKEEIIEVIINDKSLLFNHTMNRTRYGIKFNSPSFFKKMKENAIADDFVLKGKLKFE